MKFFTITFAVISFFTLLVSCSDQIEDNVANDVLVEKTFGVTSSNNGTRVCIQNLNNGQAAKAFVWEGNEDVSVFAQGHTEGREFHFSGWSSSYHNDAKFTGTTYETGKYYVLYPAQSSATLTDSGHLKLNIPDVQKAVKNSFDPAACIQVGSADSKSSLIALKNVCAFFYLTVPAGTTCATITAENSAWNLAGDVEVETNSGSTRIVSFVSGKNSISLTDIPSDGGTFFIAFVPTTSTGSKITVSVNHPDGIADLVVTNKTQFVAGGLYNLGDFITTK